MTDYLEELLKQQEEEDPQSPLRSAFGTARAVRLRSDHAEAQIAHREYAARADGEPEAVLLSPQRAELPPRSSVPNSSALASAPSGAADANSSDLSAGARPFAVSPLPLWDMVRRTDSAARLWQSRAVRPDRKGPGAIGRADEPFYRLPRQEPVNSGHAALVDAAFARDARRYDGPLRIL